MRTSNSIAKVGILCLGALGLAISARAQKQAVALSCGSEDGDTTGMRLCTELRDAIATSPRYQETNSQKEMRWGIHIISMTTDNAKTASAQAVVINLAPDDGLEYYMTSYILITSGSQVKNQAEAVLAALDKEVDLVKKSISTKQ